MTEKKRLIDFSIGGAGPEDKGRRRILQKMGKAVYAAPLLMAIKRPPPARQQGISGPPPPPNG